MLSLSEVTGREVRGANGESLGRIGDLTTRLGIEVGAYLVDRVVVRRRHRPDLLVPWTEIESFERTGVWLRRSDVESAFAVSSITDALEDEEILLSRDVLDTQIVDVAGSRLARVADVVLNRDAQNRLEVVGVDVGIGAVLRRLGLRRLASRTSRDVVAWTDLHLTSERGHSVQLATPRSAVHHLDPAQLALLVSELDVESATEVVTSSPPRTVAEAVRVVPASGERVLRALPDEAAEQIVAAMPPDHASRWRTRLSRAPRLHGRRFLQFRVWPRRRHLPSAARHSKAGGNS